MPSMVPLHTRSLLLAMALLCGVAAPARAQLPPPSTTDELAARWQRLDRLHLGAVEDERRLMWGLLGASFASVGVGGALLISDRADQGLRVAGGVTLGFAAIDIALAAMALGGQREQRQAWAQTLRRGGDRRALLVEESRFARDQGQVAWVFALNLGLDAGYVMAGAAAAAASAFSVEHPDRWLAGGLAGVAQGLILVAIDTVGLLRARQCQGELLDGLAEVALTPTVSPPPVGAGITVGIAGRF